MIATEDVSLHFGGRTLFENVTVKFTPGNCYGLIGANGAGKSTFLRILSGEQESSSGQVMLGSGLRLSVLKQNHFEYDDVPALQAVVMGHSRLHEIAQKKDAIYAKPDFSDEDGMEVAELETEFADLDGWNAEADAATLLSSLGIPDDRQGLLVKDLDDNEKVRVLLAQALFGNPDVLLLDEPTNHLDVDSILWLEEFLMDFKATVIVVSHDRHFLDKVCTHIADVDFLKISMFTGNYSFWYHTSQMAMRQKQDSNKRKEDKMKELKTFIQRFSANASKSRQASSRKALLGKITLEDIRPSSRKYPYIVFNSERELAKDVLFVEGLTKTLNGEVLFKNLNFTLAKNERIALTGNDAAVTALLRILAGDLEADAGEVKWGRSVGLADFPKEHDSYFDSDDNLIDWLRGFSENKEEEFVRGFLGRMLFKGEETKKNCRVLSGGEKVRCLLSRMMLKQPNCLLLDGPTYHLDLESITALNNGLLKFEGSMILASHDVQFVDSLVSRVLELAGEKSYDLGMGYEEYLADPARRERHGKAPAA